MKCDLCGKKAHHTKYEKESRTFRCAMCYYGYSDGSAPLVPDGKIGFEPYTLDAGFIDKLPDTWPGRHYKDGKWCVSVKDKGHEKATLDAIGCHIGDRGEKIGNNGTLEFKGWPKAKVYSFLGKNRKASTCQ